MCLALPARVVELLGADQARIDLGGVTKLVSIALVPEAQVGDYAIFFRKAAVEITFENDRYLVVPQAAILALSRE